MAASRNTEAGNPRFTGKWSNKKCIEIAFSDFFPSCVKDTTIQKRIIDHYLSFYLGGKPQKGLTVADLSFAVISIMPSHENTEQFLWRDLHYKDSGTMFFLTPEDKLKAEVGNIDINETKLVKTNNVNIPPNGKGTRVESKGSQQSQTQTDINKINDNNSNEKVTKIDESKKLETVSPSTSQEPKTNDCHKTTAPGGSYQQSNNNTPLKLPSNIQWYARAPKKIQLGSKPPVYGPVENSAFVSSCNNLLKEWETNQQARIVLKYFFGIAALILMRSTTKKYTHLVNTFKSKKFLTPIALCRNYLQYSIPHKNCFKNSYRNFSKRDGNTPVMFAKIVMESFHIDALRRNQKGQIEQSLNILKLTLLSHTVDYGFGLISMLGNIKDVVGSDKLDQIMAATYCDRTAVSWSRIKDFLEVYLVSTSKEATHHWARVISTEFFKDLSCVANYELSVILAVFIERLTRSFDVWMSGWVKSGVQEFGSNLEQLKELGSEMYRKYKKKVASTQSSDSSVVGDAEDPTEFAFDDTEDPTEFAFDDIEDAIEDIFSRGFSPEDFF